MAKVRRHEDRAAFRKLLREFKALEKRLEFMERDRDELERAINRPYQLPDVGASPESVAPASRRSTTDQQ